MRIVSLRAQAGPIVLGFLLGLLALISTHRADAGEAGETLTRVSVSVLSDGAKFIGDKTGGALVQVFDGSGRLLAQGVTEGSTGNTSLIMESPLAHIERSLGDDHASVRFDLRLERSELLRVRATGPLDYPKQLRTAETELLVTPGMDLTGTRGVIISLAGLVLATEQIEMGADGGTAELDFLFLCGCPIVPGGLWDFRDYELQAELELDCGASTRTLPFEHAGDGPRYRVEIPKQEGRITGLSATGHSRLHPQLGVQRQLWESEAEDCAAPGE